MRKISLFFGVLAVLVSVFAVTPQAKALTAEEIRTLIVNLQKQLADLQKQLAGMENPSVAWCHNFNVNLGYGSSGSEVEALQTALEREGMYEVQDKLGNFSELTGSAVVGFQEKYRSEILTPARLKYGNGYVGKLTRAKLNQLYGCTATASTPSITSVSPTSGAANDMITVYGKNLVDTVPSGIMIEFLKNGIQKGTISSPISVQPDGLSLTFKLSGIFVANAEVGAHQIRVVNNNGTSNTVDFGILGSTIPSITVLSPNGGEAWTFGTPQTIKWTAANLAAGKTFGLYLMNENNFACKITSTDATNGITSTSITLQQNQSCSNAYFPNLIAGKYKLFIDAAFATGIENSGDSSDGFFNIVAASTTSCSDSDGGKNYSLMGATVGLAANGVSTMHEADSCVGSTLVEWFCDSSNYVTNTNYTCANGCQNGACVAATTTPSITVVSPNGGEVLNEGQVFGIKWSSQGLPYDTKINIYAWRKDGLNGYIAKDIPFSLGEYNWKVKTELSEWGYGAAPVGRTYAVLLSAATTSYQYKISVGVSNGVSDDSDSYFTVNKSPNPDLTLIANGIAKYSDGFGVTVCNEGSKDIYDSTKKIEAEIDVYVPRQTDIYKPVKKILSLMGANLRAGECKESIKLSYSEFKMAEKREYGVTVILDPNNLIEEMSEGGGRAYYFIPPLVTASSKPLMLDVSGLKSTYLPGEKISLFITASEYGGALASADRGFNVQSYIYDSARTKTYDGVNGVYDPSTGLWKVILTAPTDTSLTYDLQVSLYCATTACIINSGDNRQVNNTSKFTLATGALSFSLAADTPPSLGVIMGTTNNVFTKIKFSAAGEGSKIRMIRVTREGGADADFGAIKLYDGTTLLNAAYLLSGSAIFNFPAGSELIIPKDSPRIISVKADVANYISANSGDAVKLGIGNSADVSAVGQTSGRTLDPSGSAVGSEMYLFRTLPVVSLNPSSPSGSQVAGTNKEVFRFDVKNTSEAFDLIIRQIRFTLDGNDLSSIEGKQFRLFKSTDLVSELNSAKSLSGHVDMFWPAAVTVPSGGKVTFVLTGDVSTASGNLRASIEAGDFYWSDISGGNTNKAVKDLPVRGGTLIFPVVAPSSVTVTSPNGGETWTAGSSQTITWQASNISSSQAINIVSLKNVSGSEYDLLYNTPNDGSQAVTVPNLAPGSYKVYLETVVAQQAVSDASDNYFSIVAATTSACSYLLQDLANHYLGSCGVAKYDPVFDFNKDKIINSLDNSLLIANQSNETWCSAMKAASTTPCSTPTSALDRERQLATISDALAELMEKIKGLFR